MLARAGTCVCEHVTCLLPFREPDLEQSHGMEPLPDLDEGDIYPQWFVKPCDMRLDELWCIDDDGEAWVCPVGDTMRIVGVAPGCGTHIFTAVDAFHGRSGSHSPENEHCIKIASNHYRSACGFKQHTAWLNGLLHRPGFDRMQSKISQIKGCASASALQLHVLHMVGLMEQGKAL